MKNVDPGRVVSCASDLQVGTAVAVLQVGTCVAGGVYKPGSHKETGLISPFD